MAADYHIGRSELIGTKVTKVTSKNPSLDGLYGTVLDETENTITLNTPRGPRRLLKHAVTLEVARGNQTQTITGTRLIGKHHERLKK
jgi:RNase P/RNase MRP subunit p29